MLVVSCAERVCGFWFVVCGFSNFIILNFLFFIPYFLFLISFFALIIQFPLVETMGYFPTCILST